MNLAVDIGNTTSKAGLFDKNQLLEVFKEINANDIPTIADSHQVKNIIISSVSFDTALLEEQLYSYKVFKLTYQLPVPVIILYSTPHTLGMDRLAAVAGAASLYPQQSNLVIDAGSCITYDFIDSNKKYFGGNITPGLLLKLKALNTFTARLPLVPLADIKTLTGKDTQSSILSGIVFGSVSEMEGLISLYRKEYGNFNTILCGGDAIFFESKLKEHIFVIPHLVLIGLNSILEYNVSKKHE